MRLFAAVLPPPPVLEHLELALTSVRGPAAHDDATSPLRWTVPDDRHLTLAFYGEVQEGLVEDVAERLAARAAQEHPFDLRLRGAGSFDRRTLWVGCGGDTTALGRVTSACVEVGADLLGRQDDRIRSRAHLTVARVTPSARRRPSRQPIGAVSRSGESRAADLAHALAVYQGPTWTVRDLVLVASTLGAGPSGHPRHDVVEHVPLVPVAG